MLGICEQLLNSAERRVFGRQIRRIDQTRRRSNNVSGGWMGGVVCDAGCERGYTGFTGKLRELDSDWSATNWSLRTIHCD